MLLVPSADSAISWCMLGPRICDACAIGKEGLCSYFQASRTLPTRVSIHLCKDCFHTECKIVGPNTEAFRNEGRATVKSNESAERGDDLSKTPLEYADPEVLIAEDCVRARSTPTEGPTGVHTSFVRRNINDPVPMRVF
jgi:hypothetical protein